MSLEEGSIFFTSCDNFSALGITVLFLSLTAILLNSLPLYIFLSWDWTGCTCCPQDRMAGFLRTTKRFVTSLVCVDFCSMMLLVPSLLLLEFINAGCMTSVITSRLLYEHVCGAWALAFISLKMAALLLVACAGFATYACARDSPTNTHTTSKKLFSSGFLICNVTTSMRSHDMTSSSASLTSNGVVAELTASKSRGSAISRFCFPRHARTLTFVIIGLFLLAFFVGAQPIMGAGPMNVLGHDVRNYTESSAEFRTEHASRLHVTEMNQYGDRKFVCNLKSFSVPMSVKEYVFPISLLLLSVTCLLMLSLVVARRLCGDGGDTLISGLEHLSALQACVYFGTWTPVLVYVVLFATGVGDDIDVSLDSIVVLVSFVTSLVNPLLYVKYLGVTRSGFKKFWGACVENCKLRGSEHHV